MKLFVRIKIIGTIVVLFTLLWSGIACADPFAVKPVKNHGHRWRIGYLQGGNYASYQRSMVALIEALMRNGWIDETALPTMPDDKNTRVLWQWLAHNINSDYLQFVDDAYNDCGWKKQQRPVVKQQLLHRLNGGDIDIMLALGTWAGQDLANNSHHVPTLVMSTTDPLAAGIIKRVDDSGYDHIHAKIDPERHKRQVRLFHDVFHFKTLGVVYENSREGRGFAAIGSVELVAKELGFKVESCYAPFNDVSQQQAAAAVVKCYTSLADKVDAVYLTRHPGVTHKNLVNILAPLQQKKIPTFAQGLSDMVAYGVLMSISLADFSYIGDFYATTLAKICNGAKPRQLPQRFENPPKIALNLKTAQSIGYDPSVDILGAADEIFTTVALVK